MNQRLIRPATDEEIYQALFMMHPEKAPGPDGMLTLFYQHSWPIIQHDLLDLVNYWDVGFKVKCYKYMFDSKDGETYKNDGAETDKSLQCRLQNYF